MLPQSDAFVLFGATGDLAYKKIFPALQAMIRHGELDVPIIGISRAGWSLDKRVRGRAIRFRTGGVDAAAFAKLAAQLRFVDGDYSESTTYQQLRRTLGALSGRCTIGDSSSMLARGAGASDDGGAKDARVIVEKPFGRDLASPKR